MGLGNPGSEYEHTYHNIGAWSLAYFKTYAEKDGLLHQLIFMQPDSFMNESGRAVSGWLKNKNFGPESLVIIHDDSDLNSGSYKFIKGGGSAGHKGLESIINQLGTEEFWRLRIGIRDPGEPVRKKAMDFVLRKFPKDLEPVFEQVCAQAWQEIKKLL